MTSKPAVKNGKKVVKTLSNGLTEAQMRLMLDNGIDPTLYVQKHNPAAGTPTGVSAHGPGGMFSQPGVNPRVYSAIPRPFSLISQLNVVKSEYENELISILTAQPAGAGTNPTSTCGDPVTPGNLHKVSITRRFGKYFIGGESVDVTEIGKLNNRADVERVIMNAPSPNPFMPDLLARPNVNFRSEEAQQLYRIGISLERALASRDITGNSSLASSSAARGYIREYDGLDRIVTSGIVDSAAGTAAPAADSLVVTWGSTLGATVGGRRLMESLHEGIFSRIQLANKLGIPVTRWALTGDERMFFMLTREAAVYASTFSYSDSAAATPINRELNAINDMRNAMLDGQYLQVANLRIPFLFSSGEETSANASTGELTSNLYFVPIEESNGDLLYLEYFPFDNRYIAAFNGLTNTTGRVVLNNGMYMLATRSGGFCDQLMIAGHIRMILLTPFLAARWDSLKYNSYTGFRNAFPGSTGYYGGGVSSYS